MKAQSILKFVFGGLLVFALSTLFYQNSQANANAGISEKQTAYQSVYQSNTAVAENRGGTDNPGQSAGDK